MGCVKSRETMLGFSDPTALLVSQGHVQSDSRVAGKQLVSRFVFGNGFIEMGEMD